MTEDNQPNEQQDQSPANRDESLGLSRTSREPQAPTGAINADEQAEVRAHDTAVELARSLFDDRCDDVLVLDVRQKSQVTDYIVIATGTSSTQIRAAANNAAKHAKTLGFASLSDNLTERDQNWVIIDLVDLVVHVFDTDTRMYYDLEMLWGDAKRIPWARPEDDVHAGGTAIRNRAGLLPDDETQTDNDPFA